MGGFWNRLEPLAGTATSGRERDSSGQASGVRGLPPPLPCHHHLAGSQPLPDPGPRDPTSVPGVQAPGRGKGKSEDTGLVLPRSQASRGVRRRTLPSASFPSVPGLPRDEADQACCPNRAVLLFPTRLKWNFRLAGSRSRHRTAASGQASELLAAPRPPRCPAGFSPQKDWGGWALGAQEHFLLPPHPRPPADTPPTEVSEGHQLSFSFSVVLLPSRAFPIFPLRLPFA